jgi:nucleoside-diphosphate-sugar epimerase
MGGPSFPLFGDGTHVRDFTYVGDVVAANIAAMTSDPAPGTVVNIAGGGSTSMAELIALLGELAGQDLEIEQHPPQPGDVKRTGGDVTAAAEHLGWRPTTDLETGLRAQVDWVRGRTQGL